MYVGPWQEYQLSQAKHNALGQLRAALQAAAYTYRDSESVKRRHPSNKHEPLPYYDEVEHQSNVLTRRQVQQTLRTLPLDTLQTLLPMLIPANSQQVAVHAGTDPLLAQVADKMKHQQTHENKYRRRHRHAVPWPSKSRVRAATMKPLHEKHPTVHAEQLETLLPSTKKSTEAQSNSVEDPTPHRKTSFWKSAQQSLNTSLYQSNNKHPGKRERREHRRPNNQGRTDNTIPSWMQKSNAKTSRYISSKIREHMRKEDRGKNTPSSRSSVSTATSKSVDRNPAQVVEYTRTGGKANHSMSGKDEIKKMRDVYMHGMQREKNAKDKPEDTMDNANSCSPSSRNDAETSISQSQTSSNTHASYATSPTASTTSQKDPPREESEGSSVIQEKLKAENDHTTHALISLLERQMQKQAELTNQLQEQAKVQQQMRDQIASLLAAQMNQSVQTRSEQPSEENETPEQGGPATPSGNATDDQRGLIDVSAALKLFGMSESFGPEYRQSTSTNMDSPVESREWHDSQTSPVQSEYPPVPNGHETSHGKANLQLEQETSLVQPVNGTVTATLASSEKVASVEQRVSDRDYEIPSIVEDRNKEVPVCSLTPAGNDSCATQGIPEPVSQSNSIGNYSSEATTQYPRLVEKSGQTNYSWDETSTARVSSVQSDQLRFHVSSAQSDINGTRRNNESPRNQESVASTVDAALDIDKAEVDELLKWTEELDV
eukprot:gb/GECG01010592.1/.p1 GENE.gb/GECG01010592.1/~~gb/GECG01010592.1/.p1  ORF type:complete len:716 (+),score=97.51 gb/GECG01010592.1/:1-2148(+)